VVIGTKRTRFMVAAGLSGLALVGALLVEAMDSDDEAGNALHAHGVVGGSGPVAPGDALTFGQIRTWNEGDRPVKLLSARFLRLDPDLESLGFTAIADPNAPATAREHPVPGAVSLSEFPPQPPAQDTQFVVLYSLQVRPGKKGGVAAGVELRYRQGDAVRTQTFPAMAYVCAGDPKTSHCDEEIDLGSYDEEVKKRPGATS
jgi:hypothetical protein